MLIVSLCTFDVFSFSFFISPEQLLKLERGRLQALKAIVIPIRKRRQEVHVIRPITDSLIRKVENALVQIRKQEDRLTDLLNHPVVLQLSNLKNILREVCEEVKNFHENFKKRLCVSLPKVRSGEEEEGILQEILEWRNQSPCNGKIFASWLQNKKADINVLAAILYNRNVHKLRLHLDFTVAMVIKRHGEHDEYSSIVKSFNVRGEPKNPEFRNFFPMIERLFEIRKVYAGFFEFAENNKHLSYTECVILEETLKQGEESNWDIFLKLYEKGSPVSGKFLPPPNIHSLQVTARKSTGIYSGSARIGNYSGSARSSSSGSNSSYYYYY